MKARSPFGGREGALIVVGVLLYALCLAVLAVLTWQIVSFHSYESAGVWYGIPPDIPHAAVYPLGVNVSLEQYGENDLDRALEMVREGGYRWVRQRFPWNEIEPRPGEYDWSVWDRVVDAAESNELSIIAV
ncbi:MAG TPA: hypothetical protein ENO24_00395, partial [Chloroflexi bacterium]|nr:hypothetical protein [Chloroflexota bacterium]